VLEYTCSELQSEGKPFAIVLYLKNGEACPLRVFVLKEWELMLPSKQTSELNLISELLDDLKHYSQESKNLPKQFFSRLEALSVGPIRKFVSGSCVMDDLDSLFSTLFWTKDSNIRWQRFFDRVGISDEP
jgi:hypothetical protein